MEILKQTYDKLVAFDSDISYAANFALLGALPEWQGLKLLEQAAKLSVVNLDYSRRPNANCSCGQCINVTIELRLESIALLNALLSRFDHATASPGQVLDSIVNSHIWAELQLNDSWAESNARDFRAMLGWSGQFI